MNYLSADIHTRINLKANLIILYGRPTIKHLIARILTRPIGLYESRFGMMTEPEQYKEPRNAGNPTY